MLIESIKSKLIFGNVEDSLVALALQKSNQLLVLITKTNIGQFDPKEMSLDIGAIASVEQLTLVGRELLQRVKDRDVDRVDFLLSLLEDYVQDDERGYD